MGILVAALALAACATAETETAQASGERDCFNSDSIHGYSVVDDHTVAVRVGANRSYLLRTSWNARDLDWTQRIAIRSTTGWICTGNGLGVDVIGGTPQRTYPVMEIARAPEEPAQQGS
jgi:hypothetical protein